MFTALFFTGKEEFKKREERSKKGKDSFWEKVENVKSCPQCTGSFKKKHVQWQGFLKIAESFGYHSKRPNKQFSVFYTFNIFIKRYTYLVKTKRNGTRSDSQNQFPPLNVVRSDYKVHLETF